MSLYAQQVAISYEMDPISDQETQLQIYLQSLTEEAQLIRAINLSIALPEGCLEVASYSNVFTEAWTDYLQEVQTNKGVELMYQEKYYSQRWQYGCADPGLPSTSAIVVPAKGEAPLLGMTVTLSGSCLDHFYLEQQTENPLNQIGDTEVQPINWTIIQPETEISIGQEQSIHIYPNPVKDWLNLSFEGNFEEAFEVKLISQDGKTIWMKQLHPLEMPFNRFNLQDLPSAVYLLQIRSTQNSESVNLLKIIKQ